LTFFIERLFNYHSIERFLVCGCLPLPLSNASHRPFLNNKEEEEEEGELIEEEGELSKIVSYLDSIYSCFIIIRQTFKD